MPFNAQPCSFPWKPYSSCSGKACAGPWKTPESPGLGHPVLWWWIQPWEPTRARSGNAVVLWAKPEKSCCSAAGQWERTIKKASSRLCWKAFKIRAEQSEVMKAPAGWIEAAGMGLRGPCALWSSSGQPSWGSKKNLLPPSRSEGWDQKPWSTPVLFRRLSDPGTPGHGSPLKCCVWSAWGSLWVPGSGCKLNVGIPTETWWLIITVRTLLFVTAIWKKNNQGDSRKAKIFSENSFKSRTFFFS